jgi:uncharacterized protein YjbJ (UPF0337 family)
VGEWTGDTDKQVHGAAKQVEGKVQNAWGKTKDAAKSAEKENHAHSDVDETEAEDTKSRKKAS